MLVQEGESATLDAWNVHRSVVAGFTVLAFLLGLGILVLGGLLAYKKRLVLKRWWTTYQRLVDAHPRALAWTRSLLGRAGLLFGAGVFALLISNVVGLFGLFRFLGVLAVLGAAILAAVWVVQVTRSDKKT